ncbi:hypothetical protein IR010_04055 [Flavobacterium sp. MR2016-29]|uniref:hypothetical protein n=1 Tax=Flavobacterium sp. MR2016-29 TaxID=2783795 RepID=UPI00188D0DD5|nr:hypothetical protein [Flavobacterium sp. MR2016-29]MBF4491703.1 hypothetical protein [Flavobacterium sp. MR2016-29]
MKLNLILIIIIFCSCTNNKFSGSVRDFDTDKPIKNVLVNINGNTTQTDSLGYFNSNVNCNSSCILYLKKEGYADKEVNRKPDSSEKNDDKGAKKDIIYMFKKDSDFLNKIR